MEKVSARFAGSVAAVGLSLLLAACGSSTPTPAPASGGSSGAPQAAPAPAGGSSAPAPAPAKEKPQIGGIHRFVTSNPRIGQDPHTTTGSSHFGNYGRAYSNLLRYKIAPDVSEGSFIIAADLAEKWETANPTTWTITLKKGVKWHNVPPVNGREFVADDVVYSVNRMKAPGGAQSGYWQDLDKVEAVDKYTVKFTLKNPSAPFLSVLAFGFNKMVAKEAVEAGGGTLDKGPLIGTGPWLVTCSVDVECVFKKNADSHLRDADGNQLPYLDGMLGLVMPDVQAVFAAFRSKQIDIYSMTADERGLVERSHPEVQIKEIKSFAGQIFHFRNDKAPWSDERVRMAVSKAINRQEIIDTVWGGKGWFSLAWANPADDWFLPQDEFKKAYKQDIEGAKKLLADAGYANGIDASLWCANYGVTDVPVCELMTQQLSKVGIRIKINVHDRPVYLSKVFIRNGQFDDLAYGPQGSFLEPDLWLSAYYHSKGGRNSGNTNDAKLDQMIEAQRREMDAGQRKKLILDIQRYILEKNFGIVITTPITQNAWWPWLKNRSFSAAGDYPGYRVEDHFWIDKELRKKMGAPD